MAKPAASHAGSRDLLSRIKHNAKVFFGYYASFIIEAEVAKSKFCCIPNVDLDS